MVEEHDIISDVELHLLNEWHLRNARARRREREKMRRAAEQRRRLVLCYWLVAGVLWALAGLVLWGWG